MARLRVGDIEIDGANISIGGVPQVPVTPGGAASAAPGASSAGQAQAAVPMETTTTVASHRGATVAITRTAPATSTALARGDAHATTLARREAGAANDLDGLADLPIGERVLVGGGLALLAGGAVLFALTAAAIAVVLTFSGAGAVTLAALKRRAVNRRALAHAAAAERELAGVADALRPLLAEVKPEQAGEQTVEQIAARASLPEATVIRALAFMRGRGEVTEELNTDTGEWYYALVPALPGPSLALDERLALIDGAERKR